MKTIRTFLFAIAISSAAGCAASTGPGAGDDMNMQSGDVTLDGAGFVDDGTRWWTNQSGPLLVGTYEGSPEAVVDVSIGGHVIRAQAEGGKWMAQLPDGAITTADTLVTITSTEPGGATQTRQQAFAVDDEAPVLTAMPSPFHDETGDVIDFSSGEPVHDHQGATVDLTASQGFTLVHKYGYLMDHSPVYGREVTANPLRWNFDVSDAKVASVEYRLRVREGAVVRDWTPVAGSGSSFPVILYRDGAGGLGELANQYDTYVLEIRARDWSGLESLTSYGFEYEPLAAPLAFAKAAIATGPDALASWTLAANSPISRLTNAGVGPVVFEQSFTQYANEPVTISVLSGNLSGSANATIRQGWFAGRVTQSTRSCPTSGCPLIAAPDSWQIQGDLSSHTKVVEVVDASGAVLAPNGAGLVTIPPRAAGGAPADYRIQLRLSAVANYNNDPATFVYGERSYLDLAWTGTAASQTTTACARVSTLNGLQLCTAQGDYAYARAIDGISLSLSPIAFTVKVGATPDAVLAPPTYVTGEQFLTPAFAWNGGAKSLGGY